jgi:hypothetical protein
MNHRELDLDALHDAAINASAGPWKFVPGTYREDCGCGCGGWDSDLVQGAFYDRGGADYGTPTVFQDLEGTSRQEDIDFVVAFNPAVALELLHRLAEAETLLEGLRPEFASRNASGGGSTHHSLAEAERAQADYAESRKRSSPFEPTPPEPTGIETRMVTEWTSLASTSGETLPVHIKGDR